MIGLYIQLVVFPLEWIYGTISDKIGTRKPNVVIGALVAAIFLTLLPYAPSVRYYLNEL